MPRAKLTDALVRSAKPVDGKLTEYSDTKETGLCLRVTKTGAKSWTYRYRTLGGKQQRFSIGKLRDVSLADARARVVAHRASVADGRDPAQEAAIARDEAKQHRDKETVKDIGEWYFSECEAGRHKPNAKTPKRASTISMERFYFDGQIVPRFGKRKLIDLTRASIQSFVNELADQSSKSAARQCRVILHGVYAFAQRQDLTDKANPCQFVTVAAHMARKRVLTDVELQTIWEAVRPPVNIDGACMSSGVAYSILLAMVTLQRRGEVTGMALNEIDREKRLWILPDHRTKNHRTHVVPLSDLAMKFIDEALAVRTQDSPYVFPSPRNAQEPINPKAMTRAFGRMRSALELGDMRPHDMRRTGATNLTSEALGFPRFTVSKVLNHASDTGNAAAVTSIYDQNEYLPDKRRALDAWARLLLEIVEGKAMSGNVIAIR